MAGKKGTVTLLTDQFSRGTDFLLEDKSLIEAGGFHVIQTYVSKDESDYVQVCGRTARQGKKGSYQMVINQD
jgi:preprotein translocase subunit SecA